MADVQVTLRFKSDHPLAMMMDWFRALGLDPVELRGIGVRELEIEVVPVPDGQEQRDTGNGGST